MQRYTYKGHHKCKVQSLGPIAASGQVEKNAEPSYNYVCIFIRTYIHTATTTYQHVAAINAICVTMDCMLQLCSAVLDIISVVHGGG